MCTATRYTCSLLLEVEKIVSTYTHTVCGDPSKSLPRHAYISSLNGSVVTFSCDTGYSLHGSTTSQCVSGEWTPSPETVMCVANQSEWNFSLYAYHYVRPAAFMLIVATPNAPTISECYLISNFNNTK